MTLPGAGLAIDTSELLRLRHLCTHGRTASPRKLGWLPGPVTTRRQGRGSEIDDVRPWYFGDDLRHIDRNATARTGTPHVKAFREERERTVILAADFRSPMLFGTRRALLSVAAAELLCLYGWLSAEGGARVGLLAFGDRDPVYVRPAAGNRGMMAVIGGLAKAHPSPQEPYRAPSRTLDDHLKAAIGLMPRNATFVLASSLDEPGSSFDNVVLQILHQGQLNIALMEDAFLRQAPKGRYPFVTMRGLTGVRAWSRNIAIGGQDPPGLAHLQKLGAHAATFAAYQHPENQLVAVRQFHDHRR